MSRRELPPWTLPVSWACLVFWAVVMVLALSGCSMPGPTVETTYPESAEFSTLESGRGRFGMSGTNLDSCFVIVDRSTGVQYLLYGEGKGYGNASWAYTGLCPLLDADGSPLLVYVQLLTLWGGYRVERQGEDVFAIQSRHARVRIHRLRIPYPSPM